MAIFLLTAAGCTFHPLVPETMPDKLNVWVMPPTAINWDNRPGADGVRVLFFFEKSGKGQPVSVSGTLEVYLHEVEGSVKLEEIIKAPPLRAWSFTPAQLEDFLATPPRPLTGFCYAIPLEFGDSPPRSAKILIYARFRSAAGAIIYSQHTVIPMTPT